MGLPCGLPRRCALRCCGLAQRALAVRRLAQGSGMELPKEVRAALRAACPQQRSADLDKTAAEQEPRTADFWAPRLGARDLWFDLRS